MRTRSPAIAGPPVPTPATAQRKAGQSHLADGGLIPYPSTACNRCADDRHDSPRWISASGQERVRNHHHSA